MDLNIDLSAEALAETMLARPVRFYQALLSTDSDATAWARAGAPEGALVVAGYQASPRGRSGVYWNVDHESDLAFSLVLRPKLPALREGWLYTLSTSGLADALGDQARIEWPDEIYLGQERMGAVGVQVGLGLTGIDWAVITVHVVGVPRPRAPRLKRIVDAVEARYHSADEEVLRDYLPRCRTIGRRVAAHLIPLGPAGPTLRGEAVGSLPDGGLVILNEQGHRVVVRPQGLGLLGDADDPS